jgi:hypothetical protein
MRNYLLRHVDRQTERFMAFCDRWSWRLGVVAIILAFIVIILPAVLTIIAR